MTTRAYRLVHTSQPEWIRCLLLRRINGSCCRRHVTQLDLSGRECGKTRATTRGRLLLVVVVVAEVKLSRRGIGDHVVFNREVMA